ncbi:MAG TPA: SgcJ/EcaC family oxidoreductase [Bryobacteraceae bacterium]|nr:SgcJ/EcaC family oxidoreductase [Bryobacteraceae bacterium]
MHEQEQALRELVKQMEDAWNAGDAAGFAAPFTDAATFIHIYGGQIDGRPAIEQAHRFIFGGIYRDSRNQYTVRSVRFLRPDVAMVLVEARLQFRENGEAREIQARPTMIAVRNDGRWAVEAFQNTRISEMPAAARTS